MNLLDLLSPFLRHVSTSGRYGLLPLLVVAGCFSFLETGFLRTCVALVVAYSGLFLLFCQSYYYEAFGKYQRSTSNDTSSKSLPFSLYSVPLDSIRSL